MPSRLPWLQMVYNEHLRTTASRALITAVVARC